MHLLRYRDVMLPPMRIGFKGRFTVELIDAKSGLIKRHLEFDNLITDAGLDYLGTGANYAMNTLINSYMAVGTGSVAPTNADTTLGAEVAASRSNSNGGIAEVNGSGPAYAYWYRKITRNFTETIANGNLTELGLFTASTLGTMWCRQLFKDGTGTPTVIVKTNADQLRVTYEIRLYSPADVTINPFVISGANYSVTTRAVNINDSNAWGVNGPLNTFWSGVLTNYDTNTYTYPGVQESDSNVLASPTGAPVGARILASSRTLAAYVGGTFYRDTTAIWEPGIANPVGGIGSILGWIGYVYNYPTYIGFQQAFTPKIPKDNTKRLTYVMRLSWGRYP